MSKIKNTLVGVVCAVATLLSSCDSHASCVEERNGIEIPNQKFASAAKKLQKKAKLPANLFTSERDLKYIFTYLSPVPLEKRKPIVRAIEPLVAGFTPHLCNAQFTSWMIEDLEEINSDDIPGYMTLLTTLVPRPKDSEHTQELLRVFLTQKSVSAAQELVNEADPLTTLFTGEGNFKYIIESLSPVPLEKRKPIVEALEPLVAGFTPYFQNAQHTGWMIANLGKINSDDIPGYMDILKALVPEPKHAGSTHYLLKVFLEQRSVFAAQTLVKEAKPLTAFFTDEASYKFIFQDLSPVPLEKRKPIVEALEPLVAGFTPDAYSALNTSWMIKCLSKVNSDDIPGYIDVLKILVPKPKDASSTHELLQVFLTQGSVSAAQELVNEAEPLTAFCTDEASYEFIFTHLSPVPLEKRKLIVEALAPLATGFTPDAYSALNTGWMIADLGKINSDDIPGYMNILNNTDYDRGSAEKTYNTLQGVLKK